MSFSSYLTDDSILTDTTQLTLEASNCTPATFTPLTALNDDDTTIGTPSVTTPATTNIMEDIYGAASASSGAHCSCSKRRSFP